MPLIQSALIHHEITLKSQWNPRVKNKTEFQSSAAFTMDASAVGSCRAAVIEAKRSYKRSTAVEIRSPVALFFQKSEFLTDKNWGNNWGDQTGWLIFVWDVCGSQVSVYSCQLNKNMFGNSVRNHGDFLGFFVHGNMMDLSSGKLTACRLPLKEYAAHAFIWKWYIPYIPQNGNFSRVDDDKELDLGGHQYPELIDLWSWSSIELIYDKVYDDPIYNLCHFLFFVE